MNNNLAELIHTAFNPHGVVVSLGGRYVKEQYQYAQAVGEALMRPDDALAIIEAESSLPDRQLRNFAFTASVSSDSSLPDRQLRKKSRSNL